jgi:hypothetical protein
VGNALETMKKVILIFSSIVLASCDKLWFVNEKIMLGVNGYVYSPTDEPIDSVTVYIYRDSKVIDTVYTDSAGYFHGIKWEQCFSCPTLKYEFKKKDFKTKMLNPKEYFFNNQANGQVNRWDSLAIVLNKE